jgi:RNA polymerase sigma-70 factor (ECF subfamily)
MECMDALAGWAEAAQDGDPVAAAALVRATQSDVWRLCAAMVDVQEADDLTQDTYLRALGALTSYAGRAPFRLWLLGIARNTCADHLRSAVRRRRLTVRLLSAPAEAAPDAAGAVHAREALAGLDADRRAAFALTQLLGLSYDEAAVALDVPVGTIRSRVSRAREQLLAEHRQAQAR